MQIYKIYCLKDPISKEVRYVGVTVGTLKQRLSQHKHDAIKKLLSKHVSKWFRKLIKLNQFPIIELLEEVTKENWEEKEKFWIKSFSNLTNIREGGKGVYVDRETSGKQRSANAHKKGVYLLDKDLKLINYFESVNSCAKFLNVCHSAVGKVLNKQHNHVKGYLVISKKDYEDNSFEKIFKGRTKNIYQYNLKGELIKKYNSLTEAANCTGFRTANIKTACKYLWSFNKFIWSHNELDNIMEIVAKKLKRKNNIKI